MRERIPALIITFSVTADAMAMEKYCMERNMPGRLIPVPQEIRAGCGLAWKALPGEEERFAQILAEAGIRWETMQILDMWG